jgi:hypothetical protein
MGATTPLKKERLPIGNRSLFQFDNHEPQRQFAARNIAAISLPAPAA